MLIIVPLKGGTRAASSDSIVFVLVFSIRRTHSCGLFYASEGSSRALSSSSSWSSTPPTFRTNRKKNENRKDLNWGEALMNFWVVLRL